MLKGQFLLVLMFQWTVSTTILTPFYPIFSNRINGLVLGNIAEFYVGMLWNP